MTEFAEKKVQDLLEGLPPFRVGPGENQAQYDAVEAAIFADVDPVSPMDAIAARRMAENQWAQIQGHALRRDVSIATIKQALLELLETVEFQAILDGQTDAIQAASKRQQIANDYLSGDAKARKKAVKALKTCGLSEEEIHGRAYLTHADSIEGLGKRDLHHDNMRRELMREVGALRELF